jgi:hypothetical protein
MQGRRLKYVSINRIAMNDLVALLKGGATLQTNLPNDVQVAWFSAVPSHEPISGGPMTLNIIVESEQFDPVPDGYMIPPFSLTIEKKG